MAFASLKFAWGPYTATYNNAAAAGITDMGLVEGVRRFQQTAEGTDVRSDQYGETVIDGIYQGGNMFSLMAFKLWNSTIHAKDGTQDYLWPFDAMGASGVHGRSYVDMAGSLVLTAVVGTLAATNGPDIRTASLACYAPKHTSEHVLGSAERDVLIVFRLYPTIVSTVALSTVTWYVDTDLA